MMEKKVQLYFDKNLDLKIWVWKGNDKDKEAKRKVYTKTKEDLFIYGMMKGLILTG